MSEGRRDEGTYGLLHPEGPRHIFDEQGKCIRCTEDAERWDLGCVEEIVAEHVALERDLQEALDALREIVDSADLHNAEVEGTDICDCEVVDYHARIAAVILARHRKEGE